MPEVTLNLPTPPEGYEYTGEFRCLEEGELYVDQYGHWVKCLGRTSKSFPVIAKKRWRADWHEPFYFLEGTGAVQCLPALGNSYEDSLYKLGNYFQTEAEAKIMAQKVKQFFKENL